MITKVTRNALVIFVVLSGLGENPFCLVIYKKKTKLQVNNTFIKEILLFWSEFSFSDNLPEEFIYNQIIWNNLCYSSKKIG